MKTKEQVIEQIRKLMNYARDGSASEGEVENALGHAKRLMSKFDVEEHEILPKSESAQKAAYESIIELDAYDRAGGINPWDRSLLNALCQMFDTRMYTQSRYYRRNPDGTIGEEFRDRHGKWQDREFAVVYGLPRDVEVTIALYRELLPTMRTMLRFRYPRDWRKLEGSYCEGFVDRIYTRAREAKSYAKHSETTAIVLVKDQLVARYAEEKLNLRSRRGGGGRREIDGGAYAAGSTDGSRVSLGTNGIGSSGTKSRKELR